MIQNKEELKQYIASDNKDYRAPRFKQRLVSAYAHYPMHEIKKYLKLLRRQEYCINTAGGNKLKGLLGLYYERRKNLLGRKLGFEISPNCCGKGLTIEHIGSIIINYHARIGENCRLHGANCIGNNGKTQGVPKIGNNVDIGYGAVVIGDIEIADDVVIGANAVVNKSVTIPGSIVVGVPAARKGS